MLTDHNDEESAEPVTDKPARQDATVSLAGIYPPITTPFDEQGEVFYGALARNLDRWQGYDLAGYVVLGSNGEAAYLSEQEKRRVLEQARSSIPSDKLLIAGTGCESTRATISLTVDAAQIGVDAALVITPHFFPLNADRLLGYYHAVADASPVPVVLYNVPKFTHADMDADTIARIAAHPNIIGIKDSGGNITKIGDTIRQAGPDFQVLAGSAGFLFASLALGAVGGVVALANVAPQQAIDIHHLCEEGRWSEAAALQRRMIPVNNAVTARFGVPGLKAALDMLGWYGGPVRPPLTNLSEGERDTLRGILTDGGLL
jgi:4-hydroxy-2-oxoglutarate aldolase